MKVRSAPRFWPEEVTIPGQHHAQHQVSPVALSPYPGMEGGGGGKGEEEEEEEKEGH